MKKSLFDYQGAIFDLDGTLTDSMHVWDHLCRDWLLAKGKKPEPDLEEHIATMTVNQSAEYMQSRYGFSLTPEEIIAQWQSMVLGLYETTVPLKTGTAQLARELKAAGLKLAVATSCFPAACEAVLQRHRLESLFSAVLYTDDFPGDKHEPDIWRAAAYALGLESGECVVFEDSLYALRGIKAAGMDFAAVYDDTCTDWEHMKTCADWVFENPGKFHGR
ncbi:HAD family phosphatase [Treponema primitia]|uniref:HAD family hydrolase n=1 Tax=Treponema primitia TaxID=88058 RepID=UPI003980733E